MREQVKRAGSALVEGGVVALDGHDRTGGCEGVSRRKTAPDEPRCEARDSVVRPQKPLSGLAGAVGFSFARSVRVQCLGGQLLAYPPPGQLAESPRASETAAVDQDARHGLGEPGVVHKPGLSEPRDGDASDILGVPVFDQALQELGLGAFADGEQPQGALAGEARFKLGDPGVQLAGVDGVTRSKSQLSQDLDRQ